jgi:ABC-type transport system involved in multi-copper enzyme maturation permease subunit
MRALYVGLLVLGILLFLAGLTFTLQGYGLVGPSSGFMFQNKTWVYAGSIILVVGFFLALSAFYTSRSKPQAASAMTPAV